MTTAHNVVLDNLIEALWNVCAPDEREAVRWIASTRFIVLPFGKHAGSQLHAVPLRYLDETISVMPPTWLVRQVQAFVSASMVILSTYGSAEGGVVPALSLTGAVQRDCA